ncbi:hypothetical protein SO802_015520 [Lithocarpus litseifolius]|uniref:Uncharacterized protein n=1 Tax=Lithocarpus litseifolius TaxID=425828 RepID=A0AAW2CUJ7_9ROSI
MQPTWQLPERTGPWWAWIEGNGPFTTNGRIHEAPWKQMIMTENLWSQLDLTLIGLMKRDLQTCKNLSGRPGTY